MRHIKPTLILIIAIIVLIVFIFITYFCFYSDTISKYIPNNYFIYIHLNTNSFNYIGHLTKQWLIGNSFKNILEQVSYNSNLSIFTKYFTPETLSAVDEIGLIGVIDMQGNKNFVLILKLKNNKDKSLLFNNQKHNLVKKIHNKVWAISTNFNVFDFNYENSFYKKKFFENIQFNVFDMPMLSKVYFNTAELFNNNTHYISADIMCLKQEEKQCEKLFFKSNNFNVIQDHSFNLNDYNFLSTNTTSSPSFVHVFKFDKPIDALKNKIKQSLALANKTERQVVLPDASIFTEIISDPNVFVFEKKNINNTDVYYLKNNFLNVQEIGFFKQEQYAYVFNNIFLIKNLLQDTDSVFNKLNLCSSFFQGDNLKQAMYWQVNKIGIKDLFFKQVNNSVLGCANLEKF